MALRMSVVSVKLIFARKSNRQAAIIWKQIIERESTNDGVKVTVVGQCQVYTGYMSHAIKLNEDWKVKYDVFNVGRTFLSDHFSGRNARVTLLMPKRLTLGVAVANLAGKQNIKI